MSLHLEAHLVYGWNELWIGAVVFKVYYRLHITMYWLVLRIWNSIILEA
jgi:hypothetical protein